MKNAVCISTGAKASLGESIPLISGSRSARPDSTGRHQSKLENERVDQSAPAPYQRLIQALHNDPRAVQEVALGRRVGLYRYCGDIGRGNFSRVKLAIHQLTRDKVAIKVVDRGRLDAKALRMLSREVSTLESVHHPHILRLFEVIETLGRVHLVTEWIAGGELYDKISACGALKEKQAANLFRQIVLAVKHMHGLGFVHRDIKAENVLLMTETRVKLADFGFSTQLINGPMQQLDTFCGSPPYAAPELFIDAHYIGGPVDIWALGVLLYFMVAGYMPFRAPTVPGLRASVLNGNYTMPAKLTPLCARLIERILIHQPDRRPTVNEVLTSDWFTKSALSSDKPEDVPKPKHSILSMFGKTKENITAETKNGSHYTKNNSVRTKNGGRISQLCEKAIAEPKLCTTKRSTSVLADNFLNACSDPITDAKDTSTPISGRQITKRLFQSGNLKKKIAPMMNDKQVDSLRNSIEVLDINSTSSLNKDISLDSKFSSDTNMYPEEQGDFVMLPTNTLDLSGLNKFEVNARKKLEELGITSEMLCDAIEAGPRSDIIGAYRVIVHRLQREESKDYLEDGNTMQPIPRRPRKTSKACVLV